MTIFTDASALVSFYDTADRNHTKAKHIASTFPSHQLVISNFVFSEVMTVLSQRLGKEKTIAAGRYIKEKIIMVRLTEELEDLAWEIFQKQSSKNVSFTDCTTFALFKKEVFDIVFSFDTDFKKNNIPVIKV